MRYCPLCNRRTGTLDTLALPFVITECAACGFIHTITERADMNTENQKPAVERPKRRQLYGEIYGQGGGGPELHIYRDPDETYAVWLNTGTAFFDGICIGVGASRQDAIADAVRVCEWMEETLQGPPTYCQVSPDAAVVRGVVDGMGIFTGVVDLLGARIAPTKRYVRQNVDGWEESDDPAGPFTPCPVRP